MSNMTTKDKERRDRRILEWEKGPHAFAFVGRSKKRRRCSACGVTQEWTSIGRGRRSAGHWLPPTATCDSKPVGETVAGIRAAGRSFLRAHCALRDAKRLLDIGYSAAVEPLMKVLDVDSETLDLDAAIERCIAKEACDVLDLYDRHDDRGPTGDAGRTDESALFARGKCASCKGPALPCARRHAEGRSCA